MSVGLSNFLSHLYITDICGTTVYRPSLDQIILASFCNYQPSAVGI